MDTSEEILREVMLGLRTTSGEDVVFERPPTFLLKRIRDLPSRAARKDAVKSLAAFGYVLETQQNAPEARRALMQVLDAVVKDLGQGGGHG